MWRDPLDELIEDLDEVVQPIEPPTRLPPYEDFIKYNELVYGSERTKKRLEADPGFHRFLAQLKACSSRTEEPPKAPSRSSTPSDRDE